MPENGARGDEPYYCVHGELIADQCDRCERPWVCPECDERHAAFDGECQHECNSELMRDA